MMLMGKESTLYGRDIIHFMLITLTSKTTRESSSEN